MLNPLEMEAYISAIASRARMKVVWEKEVEQPRTDGHTIWLPQLDASCTEKQYANLKHYVVHEVDHVRFTKFEVLKDQPTCKEGILGAIINMVEDIRVESKGAAEYLGDRLNSGMVQSGRLDQIAASFREVVNQTGHPAQEMVREAAPLLAWSHKHWTDVYPAVSSSSSDMIAASTAFEQGKKRYDKLVAGDYDAVLKNLTSTKDALALSERILREVYELDPDDERKKADEQRKKGKGDSASPDKGEGEGERGESDGEGKEGEGKGTAEGDESKGEAEGKGAGKGKGSKGREKEATIDYTDAMMDAHDAPTGATRTAMHLKYDPEHFANDDGKKAYSPCTKNDYTVHKRNGKKGTTRTSSEGWYNENITKNLRNTNPNFAHKVRTILQVRAKDRIQYGLKRGKLHQGSLYRLAVDNQHYAERIFKKRVTSDVLDSCVFLLIDQSGSMGGSKFTHAATAACMMNEVLGNILHVPVYIASFSDHGSTFPRNGEMQHIHVHREWYDQLVPNDKLISSFSTAADHGMNNNADGDAIMWAYNQIAPRPEKRKLIIVFSDGSPAGGYRGDCPWYTKKVVQGIERETPVNIVGIGILDKNVTYIYKENHVINNVNKLEEALLSTIEGKLK